MATDTEDLVISISADTRQILNSLKRLVSDTKTNTDQVKNLFNQAGSEAAGSFDQVPQRIRAAGDAAKRAGNDIQRAMKGSSVQTANLAAQFQDIGVQLQSGTSPLTIALQQGTQIQAALGNQGAGAAVRSLGAAFASLVNPVGLATIAIIAAGGYAVQYFSTILSNGDKSEETLKKEVELLDKVAQKWGDAVPAVKAYADERKRALDAGELQQATQLTIDDMFKVARGTVKDLNIELADLVSQLRLAGAPSNEITAVQNAFTALKDAVDGGKDSTKENKALLEALATAYFNRGVPAADEFARKIHDIADGFAEVAKNAKNAELATQAALNLERFRGFNGPPGAYSNPLGINLPQNAPTPGLRPSFEDIGQSVDSLNAAIKAFTDRVVQAESGGNRFAKSSKSSATGVGQFIESTWLDLFKKYYPQQAATMGREAILALRTDADISYALIQKYAGENARVLQAAGVTVNEAALQLAHFLGAGDAAKVLNAAPGTPLAGLINAKSIAANPTILGGGRTVDDVIAYAQRRASGSTGTGANRRSPEDIFQGSVDQIQKRIDALNAEYEAQAKLNPLVKDYGFAAEKARIEANLLADAHRAGVEVTPELAAKISQLAENYAAASAAGKQLSETQQKIVQQQQELNDFGRDVFGGIIQGLREGKSAGEIFAGVLDKIADKLANMALESLFPSNGVGGLFGGLASGGFKGIFGGALIPGILHSGGVAGTMTAGRSVPASTFIGAPRYHNGTLGAGLRAGEVPAILQRGEMVIPKGGFRGGGSQDVVTINLRDDSGRMAGIADQRIQTHSGTIVQVAVQQSTKTVKGQLPGMIADAQSRNM